MRRSSQTQPGGLSRRQLLLGGAVAGAGAVSAVAADQVLNPAPAKDAVADVLNGTGVVPFHGAHQAGIDTAPAAHATLVALDWA